MNNDNTDKVMNKNNPRKGSFTQTKVCPFGMGYAPAPRCFASSCVLGFILCESSCDNSHLPVGCI